MKRLVSCALLSVLIILAACDDVDLPTPAPNPGEPEPTSLIKNGDFSEGLEPWWTSEEVTADTATGEACASFSEAGENPWDAILGQHEVPLEKGSSYTLNFKARAFEAVTIKVLLQENGGDFTGYFAADLALTDAATPYTYSFTADADDPAASFQFQMGGSVATTVCFDDVELLVAGEPTDPEPTNPEPTDPEPTNPEPTDPGETTELLQNGSFTDDITPWWTTPSVTPTLDGGEACMTFSEAGENPWDAILGQHEVFVTEGGSYALSFDARADEAITVKTLLQENGGSFTGYFAADTAVGTDKQSYSYDFTTELGDPAASFQFQMGGTVATTVCFSNVSLKGQAPGETPDPGADLPSVRVNQHAYLPGALKRATVVSEAAEPLDWTLEDSAGTVLLSGQTVVFGPDASSGDSVHTLAFSAYTTEAEDLTLRVAGESSHSFAVRADAYRTLKYDALRYFYHNRSGTEIEAAYTGGGGGSYAADARWARPAGHLSRGVNKGDTAVPCWPLEKGANWSCDYTLDVTGGWYDAGDHGKYVVNGGISAWTLMNLYERALHVSEDADFDDGTLNLPESANGVPDVLDEARWQLEFMLAMQAPAGTERAGMAHHKIHDEAWTGLGLAPHEDAQVRYLVPPTTQATLNLAATAAQCARLWRDIDADFSGRCLSAAETAWAAAQAQPELYYDDCCNEGGGPYGDDDASDEFYWAAAELYITTEKTVYFEYMRNAEDYLQIPIGEGAPSSMYWGGTSALGNLSLLTVPNGLGEQTLQTLTRNLLKTADVYAELTTKEGYGVPFTTGPELSFPWGSNSSVLNNAIVLGVAYDLSGDTKYLNAVTQGVDYLLGRNAMDQSYLTGYGERPLLNPHHRFWAKPTNAAFPEAPPGAISGGPNTGLEDPVAAAKLQGCAPQTCFLDDIDSWSTNEITINWNSPMAWVAAFLDSLP